MPYLEYIAAGFLIAIPLKSFWRWLRGKNQRIYNCPNCDAPVAYPNFYCSQNCYLNSETIRILQEKRDEEVS